MDATPSKNYALHKSLVTSFRTKEREVKISVILCTMTTAAKGPIYHILHGFVGATTHTKNSWDFLSVWICHTWPRPKVVRCSTSICHLLKATRRGHKICKSYFLLLLLIGTNPLEQVFLNVTCYYISIYFLFVVFSCK